jgi:hypothetical protein
MTLPRWPRVPASIAVGVLTASLLALALGPAVLATTTGSDAGGSSSQPLLIAALGGGCLAAVWLLRPTSRSARKGDASRKARPASHAHRIEDDVR